MFVDDNPEPPVAPYMHGNVPSTGGLSQQRVAELLGISVTRVQQLERRAIGKLRAALVRRAKRAKTTIAGWLER